LSATPASAPAHTVTSSPVAVSLGSSSAQNGVYVPAMKMKIIEWSSRRMS
jgi:hypothetical protein